jgi:hypothetical protein
MTRANAVQLRMTTFRTSNTTDSIFSKICAAHAYISEATIQVLLCSGLDLAAASAVLTDSLKSRGRKFAKVN